mmetsp:Transcript_18000/g.30765  ORF Transcript_18000/g.30765 Transcript_18000/m.30765 type:complete len:292 (+) Transcript_18000:116-991(+)
MNNSENMTGSKLKHLRLNHLLIKKEELATILGCLALSDEKRAAVTTRHEKVVERIATITTKLERKVDQDKAPAEDGQIKTNEVDESAKAALKAKRLARARAAVDPVDRPGPLQRATCVQNKLAHVRSLLNKPQLALEARLEAEDCQLSARLLILPGQSAATDVKGFKVHGVHKSMHGVPLEAKLAHIKSVLARPSLPAERRVRLEAKEKMLTARLEEGTSASGGGGGKGKGKGFGQEKRFGPCTHGPHGKGGKGTQGMIRMGVNRKGHGKGKGANRPFGEGVGTAENTSDY